MLPGHLNVGNESSCILYFVQSCVPMIPISYLGIIASLSGTPFDFSRHEKGDKTIELYSVFYTFNPMVRRVRIVYSSLNQPKVGPLM